MSDKKKRKEIENGPVLVFIISLPRNKERTVIQGLYKLGSSFIPLFYDISISGTESQGYKLVMKHVSELYIRHVNSTYEYFLEASTSLCNLALWPYR